MERKKSKNIFFEREKKILEEKKIQNSSGQNFFDCRNLWFILVFVFI